MALELDKHNPFMRTLPPSFSRSVVLPNFLRAGYSIAIRSIYLHRRTPLTYSEGDNASQLVDDHDGMYYDAIEFGHGNTSSYLCASYRGLIPGMNSGLGTVVLNRYRGFKKRVEWFIDKLARGLC